MRQRDFWVKVGQMCILGGLLLVMPIVSYSADPSKAPEADTERAAISGVFSGNVKSKVYHKDGCRYFACKECSERFSSAAEAAQKGYKPCKLCIK